MTNCRRMDRAPRPPRSVYLDRRCRGDRDHRTRPSTCRAARTPSYGLPRSHASAAPYGYSQTAPVAGAAVMPPPMRRRERCGGRCVCATIWLPMVGQAGDDLRFSLTWGVPRAVGAIRGWTFGGRSGSPAVAGGDVGGQPVDHLFSTQHPPQRPGQPQAGRVDTATACRSVRSPCASMPIQVRR